MELIAATKTLVGMVRIFRPLRSEACFTSFFAVITLRKPQLTAHDRTLKPAFSMSWSSSGGPAEYASFVRRLGVPGRPPGGAGGAPTPAPPPHHPAPLAGLAPPEDLYVHRA